MMKRCSIWMALLLAGWAALAWAGEAREPITGILGAMGEEVQLLVSKLTDRQEQKVEGIEFWTGRLKGRRVVVATTGIGKVSAAVTATLLYEHFRPTEVLFSGIAGGLDPDLRPCDIVIAEKTVQHDLGMLTEQGMERRGFRSPVTGERNPTFYEADARLLKLAMEAKERVGFDSIELKSGKHAPRVIKGIVATGDVFVALPAKQQELHKELKADAVEMEGAAVAQVCYQWRVPCLVIRCLSDMADANAVRDSEAFVEIAARNSALLVADVVEHLAGAGQ
jgi:adenosylhomocysteine nucleosidase